MNPSTDQWSESSLTSNWSVLVSASLPLSNMSWTFVQSSPVWCSMWEMLNNYLVWEYKFWPEEYSFLYIKLNWKKLVKGSIRILSTEHELGYMWHTEHIVRLYLSGLLLWHTPNRWLRLTFLLKVETTKGVTHFLKAAFSTILCNSSPCAEG